MPFVSPRNEEPFGFFCFFHAGYTHSVSAKSITSQTKSLLISWKGQVLYLPLIFRKLIAAHAAHAPAAKLGRVRCGRSRRCMRGREIQGGTS